VQQRGSDAGSKGETKGCAHGVSFTAGFVGPRPRAAWTSSAATCGAPLLGAPSTAGAVDASPRLSPSVACLAGPPVATSTSAPTGPLRPARRWPVDKRGLMSMNSGRSRPMTSAERARCHSMSNEHLKPLRAGQRDAQLVLAPPLGPPWYAAGVERHEATPVEDALAHGERAVHCCPGPGRDLRRRSRPECGDRVDPNHAAEAVRWALSRRREGVQLSDRPKTWAGGCQAGERLGGGHLVLDGAEALKSGTAV